MYVRSHIYVQLNVNLLRTLIEMAQMKVNLFLKFLDTSISEDSTSTGQFISQMLEAYLLPRMTLSGSHTL